MNPYYISDTSSCSGNIPDKEPVMEGGPLEKEKGPELMVFPGIPVEIVQLIFEKAMEDTPTPVHLSFVSKQVQQWVEPLIYRNLSFYTNKSFTLFYRTFRNRRFSSSKSTAFFAKHVKTLHISNRVAPRMEQAFTIGTTLKSLRAIAGWDGSYGCLVIGFLAFRYKDAANSFAWMLGRGATRDRADKESKRDKAERMRREGAIVPLFNNWLGGNDLDEEQSEVEEPLLQEKELEMDVFSYKDLRKLSISAHSLGIFGVNFTTRMFQDITHLHIYYRRLFNWSTLTAMKNLTHLALDFVKLTDLTFIDMKHCMNDLIGYFQVMPWLKAVIFGCVTWWNRDFDLLDDEDGAISTFNFLSEDWQNGGPMITTTSDEHHLHYFTQLSLGMHDPRVVLGVVNDCVQESHLMWEYMVDLIWPKNSYDWNFTVPQEKHKESWKIAEEIIERRERERMERRERIAATGADHSDENGAMNGEFGFGEIVSRRWKEAQLADKEVV